MIKHTTIVTAFLIAAGALAAAASGCELIATVDRGKLQGNGGYGGSTTTTTTTTTATGSCPGGAMPCAMPSDCPGQSSSCVADTCTMGCCGTSDVAAGMACSDPGGKVCDGAGKCVACLAPTDCAAQASACVTNTCDATAHTCGTAHAASGTACTDSGGKACDGNGKCVKCAAPTDCTAQTTACITNTCASNTCGTSNATSGTACTDNGGKKCDGSGNCVKCLAATDCAAQTTVCKVNACDATAHTCGTTNAAVGTPCTDSSGVVCDGNGACVATHCMDGVQDADETDVDCGGSCGATCTDTAPQQMCKVKGDCVSGVCKVNAGGTQLFCQPPTCGDGVKNGNETDVDCGGAAFGGNAACAKCADKLHCAVNTDCVNNDCFGNVPGTCVSCSDGVKDGNETDVDCGGVDCDNLAMPKLCGPNLMCTTAGDCQSGSCSAGGTCALKGDGQSCTAGTECLHGNCLASGGNQICCHTACPVSSPCGNDGSCAAGGATCEQFSPSTSCQTLGCQNGMLTPAGTCNGTGACGGAAAAPCAGGFICASSTSCLTACGMDTDCQGTSNYCSNPGASGTCVAKGATGAACTAGNQCQSGTCIVGDAGSNACQ